MKSCQKIASQLITLVLVISFSLPAFSATANLSRPYDPVVIQGSSLTLFSGAPVNEIFVFVFKDGKWSQIPFQIDEKDGGDYYGAKNGILDADDEICFMAADMGDSAADFQWIEDAESYTYQRYQVKVLDVNESPATFAYAYVYRSSTLSYDPNLPDYMSYVPAIPGVANDTIKGLSYVFGHNIKSIPDYLAIKDTVGGSGLDILDRWKIRFSGKLSGFFSYSENEDTGLQFDSLQYKAGPIRVIRAATFFAVINDSKIDDPVVFSSYFYPYYAQINTGEKTLDRIMGMEVLRQSMDFAPNIVGSFFQSNNNVNIDVDGNADIVDVSLTVPGINWYMIQGEHGTITTIVDMPAVGETQQLYYKDDNTGDINDTGDLLSYGECGILVTSYEEPIFGTFGLETTMYYLGPNHTRALSDSLVDQFANPLQVAVMPREFVIPVELASFSATSQDGKVLLEWSTATESNNYGFEIERRAADSQQWEKAGFVKGMGTTAEKQTYRFVDQVAGTGDYFYRLKQIDSDGSYTYSDEVRVSAAVPDELGLDQNYPNPFNPTTEIAFRVPKDYKGAIRIRIYNLLGREVRSFQFINIESGLHKVVWDGRDNNGHEVGSGAYIYTLESSKGVTFRKMVKLQ